jgi:hypothetical protein
MIFVKMSHNMMLFGFIVLLLNTLLMVFLTIPNNKKWNSLYTKHKRGDKLTPAENQFMLKAWTNFWIVFNILFYCVGLVIMVVGYSSND